MASEVFWLTFCKLTNGTHTSHAVLPDALMDDTYRRDETLPLLVRLEVNAKTGGVSATLEKCDS